MYYMYGLIHIAFSFSPSTFPDCTCAGGTPLLCQNRAAEAMIDMRTPMKDRTFASTNVAIKNKTDVDML